MLRRYVQLENELAKIQNELAEIEARLREHVQATGPFSDFGFTAHFKPGRKSTNHEAAALAAAVPDEIVTRYTTTKVAVAWAQVTKAAGCDTAAFTVQGEPIFVIEADGNK